MSENSYECLECGEKLSPNMKSCPKCGSNKKRFHVAVANGIKFRDSTKGELKDESGKAKHKFVSRQKVSKKGKEAKEQISINIKTNKKFHHVEEQDKNGKWKTVHHEDEPLKKKRK